MRWMRSLGGSVDHDTSSATCTQVCSSCAQGQGRVWGRHRRRAARSRHWAASGGLGHSRASRGGAACIAAHSHTQRRSGAGPKTPGPGWTTGCLGSWTAQAARARARPPPDAAPPTSPWRRRRLGRVHPALPPRAAAASLPPQSAGRCWELVLDLLDVLECPLAPRRAAEWFRALPTTGGAAAAVHATCGRCPVGVPLGHPPLRFGRMGCWLCALGRQGPVCSALGR